MREPIEEGMMAFLSDGADALGAVRRVLDERIPSLAFVSVGHDSRDLAKVARGDMVRLCFVDNPDGDAYPCDPVILKNFESDNCYDRFLSSGTRHMFAGYSYVAVGAGGFFSGVIQNHFRRHYFQMALLSHLELAALLAYSHWVSQAVAHNKGRLREARFTALVRRIKEELLAFMHQYRFTGLSNQLQAGEMQAYWRKHLRLDTVFDDVSLELKTAADYLFAKDQAEQTNAATRLSVIAVLAAVLGLPMAFLGMNFVNQFCFFDRDIRDYWGIWFLATAAASSTALVFAALVAMILRRDVPPWGGWRTFVSSSGLPFAVLGMVFAISFGGALIRGADNAFAFVGARGCEARQKSRASTPFDAFNRRVLVSAR